MIPVARFATELVRRAPTVERELFWVRVHPARVPFGKRAQILKTNAHPNEPTLELGEGAVGLRAC